MDNIIKYFKKSFEIPYIEKGSYVPLSAAGYSNDELGNGRDVKVLVEGDCLESLVQEMKDTASGYDRIVLKNVLPRNIDFDENLFATLYAFTSVYKKNIGFKTDSAKRNEMYRNGSPISLGEMIEADAAKCVERAILAQLYLQEEGSVDSAYFSGEVIWNKEDEFAGGHAFILLKFNDHEYIFDPANPHETSQTKTGLLPRMQEVENFRDKISQGKKAYVETSSVFDQSAPVWYGVGDGASVLERDFV